MKTLNNDSVKFYNEYSQKTDKQLQKSLSVLSGQDHTSTPVRVEAINRVIEERGQVSGLSEDIMAESAPQTLDEVVARKFLAKLSNAKKRGINFSLSLSDMKKLVTRKTCYYTGVRLEDDVEHDHPLKRTLERLDSSVGYTKENTVACSHAANSLKNMLFERPGGSLRMSGKEFGKFASKINQK